MRQNAKPATVKRVDAVERGNDEDVEVRRMCGGLEMKWSDEDIALLRERFPHVKTAELVELFGRNYGAIAHKAAIMGIKKSAEFLASGKSGRGNLEHGAHFRFTAGFTPWNKGKAHPSTGSAPHYHFKAGQLNGRAAQLAMPVGTYRINGDGYLDRKYSDQSGSPSKRWRAAHLLIWEAANGPLPAGSVVVFKPGTHTTNPDEIVLENLELVTRQELMKRNTLHRYPKELADLCRLRGVLNRKINKAQTK